MKLVSSKLEFGHLLIGNLNPRGIDVGVEFAFHGQTGRRRGGSNEIDDDLVADQWLATPVLTDERE